MVIKIKMDIRCNYEIIKYFNSISAVIILVINKEKKFGILHHFPPRVYSIMYPKLVGSAHVLNNGSDRWCAIIENALPWLSTAEPVSAGGDQAIPPPGVLVGN